jgi:ubiquinone/menaquinone biosynthesis C-methylase UbiE
MTKGTSYIFPGVSEEYRRLRHQAGLWERITARLLDRVGVAPGMSCLDVGCGPGAVMRLLADRVGPTGSVTGVDMDAASGREALAFLRGTAAAPVEFIHGNVTELDLPTFDVIYLRLVLIHVPDPVALLRRLYDRLNPGGVLVVQDFDTAGADSFPRLACCDEFNGLIDELLVLGGGDPRCGLHLPSRFVDAGIGAPDGTDVSTLFEPVAGIVDYLKATYLSVAKRALELGIRTQQDVDACLAGFDKAAEDPRNYVRLPLMVDAYRRKP